MGQKRTTKEVKRDITKEELTNIKKEAAQRYTDTSWHIFHQSRKKSSPSKTPNNDSETYERFETIPEQNENTCSAPISIGTISNDKESESKCNGAVSVPNGIPKLNETDTATPNKDYEKNAGGPESLQIVQIETVEVTYEPAKSQVEVVLVRDVRVANTMHRVMSTNQIDSQSKTNILTRCL